MYIDRFKFRTWNTWNKVMHGFKDYKVQGKNLCNVDGPWIFMQCTGLKDCNGEDIYEGDLLEWAEVRAAVEWCDDDAMYILRETYSYEMDFCNTTKIVGNIYQNPDMSVGEI